MSGTGNQSRSRSPRCRDGSVAAPRIVMAIAPATRAEVRQSSPADSAITTE